MVSCGYIALYRKLLENPISKKPNYLAVWIYLILKANHKATQIIWNNQPIELQPGQFIGSILQISEHFKLSTGTISYILDYFEAGGMLKKKSTKKFTLFEVVNYDIYQNIENRKNAGDVENTRLGSVQASQVENKLKTNEKQIETDNKDNNVNNDKKEEREKASFSPPYSFFLSLFKKYTKITDPVKSQICPLQDLYKEKHELLNDRDITECIEIEFQKLNGKNPTTEYLLRNIRNKIAEKIDLVYDLKKKPILIAAKAERAKSTQLEIEKTKENNNLKLQEKLKEYTEFYKRYPQKFTEAEKVQIADSFNRGLIMPVEGIFLEKMEANKAIEA